jgi:hypothetical protein
LSSSAKLQNDVISDFSLTLVPWQSPKLKLAYSILVEQHGLTKSGYDYWLQVKKNTEALGTLFDPLPSRVTGNISCVTNPDESVIGYFGAASTQKKRIFIHNRDITRPPSAPYFITGYEGCELDSALLASGGVHGEIISAITDEMNSVIGYLVSSTSCVNCRLAGGTTVKPDFWE